MDKISLSCQVESRAPLVDNSIDDFSKKINFNIKRYKNKGLLKELHSKIYGRKNVSKKGFNYPLDKITEHPTLQHYYKQTYQ